MTLRRLKSVKSTTVKQESKKVTPKPVGKVASGFAKAKQVNTANREKREEGFVPFRLRLKVEDTARIILLDEKPEFFYEHHWQGSTGKWDQFERCLKDSSEGICPLCSQLGKEGYYVMMLTAIDLRPYTAKDGTEVKFSRKLLPVKSVMIPKFERLYKKRNTFRGAAIVMARDSSKGTAIGDSFEFNKFFSEEALSKYTMKNRDGKVIDLSQPVDYDKAFPRPTMDQMKAKYSGGAAQVEDSDDSGGVEDVDWD